MYASYHAQRARVPSALASAAIMSVLAYVLVMGFGHRLVSRDADPLISVDFAGPAPRRDPDPPPPPDPASAPKGAPSPPNLRNQATPVVVPPVPILLLPPPPIAVATIAAMGDAPASGASDRAGPGPGAGGVGGGDGGGGDGGTGSGEGAVVGPRQLRGRLSFSDLPENAIRPGEEAVVGVRYTVGADGRVGACRITETSRIPAVDAMACRLIIRRFRFRPARDAGGRPMPADVVESHGWSIPPEPPVQSPRPGR